MQRTGIRRSAVLGLACVVSLACSGTAPADQGTGGTASSGGAMTGGGGGPHGPSTGGLSASGGDPGVGGAANGAGTGGLGGGEGDGGAAPGGAGGTPIGACGEPPLEVMGPAVVTSIVDAPLPPATGGALLDGLYDATTQVFYGDFPLPNLVGGFRQVLRLRDGGTSLDQFSTGDVGTPQSMGMTIVPSGSDLIMSPVCPNDGGGNTSAMPYSTRPGEIDFYIDYTDGPGMRMAIITHVLRQ